MQMAFVLYDRNESALHMLLFCSGRYQSATHIAFFYAGNMPYASRLKMFFGRGLENPAGLRFIFGRGMGNRVGIRLRFIQGMDFWVGIRFIRPLAWPLVGRIQYAPTLTDEILSIFCPFGLWRGRLWGVCNTPLHGRPEKWRFFYPFDHRRGRLWGVCCCAPTRVPEKMAIFLSVRPPAWPFVGRIQYAPTRTDENRAGFWFVFRGGAEKGAGRGLCEKWGRRASIIIRRLLPLRARRRMGPIIAPAHAFIIPNYVA